MPILIAVFVFLLVSELFSFEAGIALAGLIGLLLMRREYEQKLLALQQQIEQFKKAGQSETSTPREPAEPGSKSRDVIPEKMQASAMEAAPDEDLSFSLDEPEVPVETGTPDDSVIGPSRYMDQFDAAVKKLMQGVLSYFTDGNIFVRVGLLILFFGVAFLLKYAAEHSNIPLEFRFLGAAAGGLFLLIVGWRLRLKKEIYALLLQGGGIGIIYITIFASYRLANLIPSTLTFVLLVAFALLSAALAVLQNSRSLAVFAMLGGFLAPFLASSGSGNYIALFGYYAVLNLAVFIMAWFKSWRVLNLIGFVATFAIYTLWFVFSYKSEYLYPALGFLCLFFLMYSVLGILYALRQTQNLRGLVDGTLVFGTPVIASSLMMAMLRNLDYGIALCAALLGIYYVALARWLWQRQGEQMRLMAEALLAIGVVFATLAIPYSLDGHWTSATWALEAAGILWISLRQQRRYAQWFAIALQFGAGLLFLMRNADDLGDTAWFNPAFLGGVFIALGAFISARLLYKQDDNAPIRKLHTLFYLWAMAWWLGSSLLQVERYLDHEIAAVIVLFTATAGLLTYLDQVRGWSWLPASISSILLLPLLTVMALFSLLDNNHLFVFPDWMIWPLALLANYWIITRLEQIEWPQKVFLVLHTGWILLLCSILSYELGWYFHDRFPQAGEAYIALVTLPVLLFMYWSRLGRFPVIQRFGLSMQLSFGFSLATLMLLWSLLVNITNTADPAPLPYLPLLNPIDLAHLVFFMSVVRLYSMTPTALTHYRHTLLIGLGALVFIWMSAVLLRSMHHYADVPFNLSLMLGNVKIHTALSILWTIIGMLAMLVAARLSIRVLWIAGAILVAVVLVKMFFIDLGASGTVERIVSFLVVGGLLVAMGYFSPIPEKNAQQKHVEE